MRCINVDDNYPMQTFKDDAKQGGIALVHSPSCGHCIAMKDEWDAFEKEKDTYQNSIRDGANIFRISANVLGNVGHGIPNAVRGVPTILILEPGPKVGKIYDSNDRKKSNFIEFLKKNLSKTSSKKGRTSRSISLKGGALKACTNKRRTKRCRTKRCRTKRHRTKRRRSSKK